MARPVVSLIAAVARGGGIGKGNELLWHEPLDQKHFRQLTMGCPVVMGRRTWDSLPERFRPLPGRSNIVVTRNAGWRAEGALAVQSIEAALAHAAGAERVYVMGGAEIYALALPHADELELTEIDAEFDADTFFPDWDRGAFALVQSQAHTSAGGVQFSFATYRRAAPALAPATPALG